MTPPTAAPRVVVVTAAGPGSSSPLLLLARSVERHLPGAAVLAVAPTHIAAELPGVELVDPATLLAGGVDELELHRRAAYSTPEELLCSLKPALLAEALARGAEVAIWLDADVELYGPLDPIVEQARATGIGVVRSFRAPVPDDGLGIDAASMLTTGMVATSCVAVTGDGMGPAVLEWWSARARRGCLLDPPTGHLLDRRWLEAVPLVFGAPLVDDAGIGVGYLNLHERTLAGGADGGFTVDGGPLRLFHFSGLDPDRPWLLSIHQGPDPRVLLSHSPALQGLVRRRLDELAAVAPLEERAWPFAATAGGLAIDRGQRQRYRSELVAAEGGDGPMPPDLFDAADPDAALRWWGEPVGGTAEHPRSRWGDMLFEQRVDLRVAFPDPDGADVPRVDEWMRREVSSSGLPSEFAPAGQPMSPAPTPLPGCNVVGFLGLDRGVGQSARALADAVEAAGYPVHRLDLPDPGLPPGQRALSVDEGPYDLNLLSVNPNEVVLMARSAAHRPVLEGRRNIALWFWEVDSLPEFMAPAFDSVDEIWVASRYNQALFEGWTDRPVELFPHPIRPGGTTSLTRSDLGLPPGFLFGFFFDHLSLFERKNPVGLVEAWTRAFAPTDGAVLVLKTLNGDQRPVDVERLRLAIGDRPDIVVIDRHLSGVEMRGLNSLIDAYVSLHRSEGFGLTIADAMAHAKPVIATGFSANLDYMHADNGYLVSWRPVEVGEGSWPYPRDATWADPDLDEAAAWMRHVYEHPDEAAAKGQRARRDILARHSLSSTAAFVDQRLRRWV